MGDLLGAVLGGAAMGGPIGMLVGLGKMFIQGYQKKAQAQVDLDIKREDHKHELDLRDKDIVLMKAEAESQFKIAQTEGESAIETARMQAIGQSFAADRAMYATGIKARDSGWFIAVDVVRGMIRPAITIVFDVAVLAIWCLLIWLLWDELAKLFALKDPLVTTPMMKIIIDVTNAIIFLATTATGYWFVARPDQQRRGGGNAAE